MTAPCNHLGFLSIVEEPAGFVGGYLVTNAWGRPLEFRLSSAVQPTRVQQILYGETLQSYLAGEVIGKTLVEKTATAVQCLLVDDAMALEIRRQVPIPVGLWCATVDPDQPAPGLPAMDRVYSHADYPEDAATLKEMLARLAPLDFGEPFARIREAMNEARKMGVTTRRAA